MYNIENLPSAWKGHRAFANKAVRHMNPKTVVELGVDYGFSLFSFAEAGIGTVYGIDSFEGDPHTGTHSNAYSTVVSTIEQNSYGNITLVKGYFDEVVLSWSTKIDILHIDGYHTYEAVKNDFDKWTPFLEKSGLVLLHDTVAHHGVTKLYNELDWYKYNFTHSAGLGVLSKNKELIDVLCT